MHTVYPGHCHAGWYHFAQLGDVGVHLVTPPLLYLAVILLEELFLVLAPGDEGHPLDILLALQRLSPTFY